MKKTISTQCADCGGTGIYHGYAEPEGIGVVCWTCNGTGEQIITYQPFVGRQHRDDIHIVRSRWAHHKQVSYKDFLAGARPIQE